MELKEGLWGGLPSELVERVLSFLPVLDLCRLRSVCRRWNELVCNAAFHDLCEQNRKENGYLSVIRHHDYLCWTPGDPRFRRTTSFLDLDSRRWYSLKPCDEVGDPRVTVRKPYWMPTMDDGLVCDVSLRDEETVVFAISDPIARTTKELPESPAYINFREDTPLIVTVADSVTRSYRVFVITDNEEQDRRIFVYESVTNEWRAVKCPPMQLGLRISVSAVIFGGRLYVIFQLVPAGRFVLLSYDLQEDVWKLYNLRMPKKKRFPQLVVSCNRLFVMMWIGESSAPEHGTQRKFHLLFEVREVLAAESSSRLVVQLTQTQLQQMFGEEDWEFDIAYGVPCCSSSGSCKSLVLMSSLTEKLISYDLASGSAVTVPAPLAKPEEDDDAGDVFRDVFSQGKYTNLSLRSLSSPFWE